MPASNCEQCAIRARCMLGQLPQPDRDLLLPQSRQRIFHRGDVLVREGEVASQVRLLKLGTSFAYRRGLDGQSRPVGALSRGSAFGMFGLFGGRSRVSVVALTTVHVCELPVAALREGAGCGSGRLTRIADALSDNFAALAAWSEAMRLPGVANQLAYVLVLLADAAHSAVVDLPSQAALAELLGTRRESVMRALRVLASEGGISQRERRRCEVDRGRLLNRVLANTSTQAARAAA